MNVRLRKDTKIFIVLFIFIISFYVGAKSSHISRVFLPKQVNIDTKEADKIFETAQNQRKINMSFRTADDKGISNIIGGLVFKDDVTIKYSDVKPDYQVYIIELDNAKYIEELTKLHEQKGLVSEHIITNPDLVIDTNIKESLENQILTKNRLRELINKTTAPVSLGKFQSDLEKTQAKIDSLNVFVSRQERLLNHDLIYLISVNQTSVTSSIGKIIGKFLTYTFLTMLFMIFGFFILYLLMLAVTSIMTVLGIRTAHGKGSSNYNYNNYNSTYGRKIKRIYKDKDGNRREDVSKE
ncbi:MAG TPA: hypothetical protein PLD62_04905 [Candidatus Cloacimonadota bacterium]|nr:hypothetical protein [Candidatus Cloacimonadota bacterium]